jgi:hypothetical protein
VHFCLSNGQIWIFFILQLRDNIWVYYESPPLDLQKGDLTSSKELSFIVQLIMEWVGLILIYII